MTSYQSIGISAICFACSLSICPQAAIAGNGVLFGTDMNTGSLLTIDTTTGVGTVVGPTGFSAVWGLAYSSETQTLYGSDIDTDQLLEIDVNTGAAVPIGPLGFRAVSGLAFDEDTGTLFGVDELARRLLTIDTTTGAASVVAQDNPIGFSAPAGLAFNSSEQELVGGTDVGGVFFVDPTTGIGSSVNDFRDASIGLAYDPFNDIVYSVTTESSLYEITDFQTDPVTANVIGSVGFTVVGLAFAPAVPEPATATSILLLSLLYSASSLRHRSTDVG